MNVTIRPAKVADVPRIAEIVNDFAERGLMLHRALEELYENMRDFHVAECDGQLAGVVGLRIMWSNLAEVYSLAVVSDCQGGGIGRALVEAVVDEAKSLGLISIFALTYEREFFERCCFEVVDRHQMLPLKVWSECHRCPKRHACDEIAMLRTLDESSPVDLLAAEPGKTYEVPLLSEPMKKLDQQAHKGRSV